MKEKIKGNIYLILFICLSGFALWGWDKSTEEIRILKSELYSQKMMKAVYHDRLNMYQFKFQLPGVQPLY